MTSPPEFFEIGTRTNFSFLEGASHPEELVVTAARLKIAGLGIADRNTVAGVVRAHAKAKMENYPFRPGARLVFADDTPDILAYPVNRRGWAHLCRLLSTGNLRSGKGTCTLYLDDLVLWHADLLLAVLPGSPAGADAAPLERTLKTLQAWVGDRLYLALALRHDGFDQLSATSSAAIAAGLGIRLLATQDALYHGPERKPLADIVTCIREHVTIAAAGYRLAANAERHLKPPEETARLFRHHPEAVANTVHFFKRLSFTLDALYYQYPDESIDGETATETLKRLTHEGARRRFPQGVPDKVRHAIDYELDLIRIKSYEPYFLTVTKIIDYARSEDILCQGRGSAANSAVCYCLGITEVNPESTSLLFERFLSTEREEPPDIDVDFEHQQREKIIRYIYATYGKEHAGLAAAVTSYRTRSAGRETAKVFGLSEDVQSALAASVWGWWTHGLSEEQTKAAGLDMSDPTTRRVMEYTAELMNFPRHLSQHVGGFVITRDRLDEVVPIMNTAMDGRYMVEWNKDDLDTLKILKIDILALGMLTCLAKCFKLLETHYGRRETLASLFNDQNAAVYDMICRADTIGVFQIESRAQMSMLPRLRPRRFYDLVIEVAIVRPGPIQGNMVHPYLKRRQNPGEVVYPKEELRLVLERTLGVPLFQEQAMQIAITAAKFTASEADQLRRAMATFRRTGQVTYFKQKMIEGMVENGYDRTFAERCFSQIEGFGEYGFPESHAASFALLVYASCWLKAFYPDVFCVGLLNSQPMGFYPPAQLVRDAREHGVVVLPVDINHSTWDATLETDDGNKVIDPGVIDRRHRSMQDVILTGRSVRLGFNLIKGVSEADMNILSSSRGPGYGSVRDLWQRTGLTRAALERLADADAFRSIGLDRRQALWEVKALDAGRSAGGLPLFDTVRQSDPQIEPPVVLPTMPDGEQVINDYRFLRLSLKAHPVSFLRPDLSQAGTLRSVDLETARNGSIVTVAGLVLVRQRPGTAKGVIFMTIEDETGVANIIIWQKIFAAYRAQVMGARLVSIRGRLQRQDGVIHVVAEHMEDMTPALGLLQEEARRFAANNRSDEVLRPTVDQRRKPAPADAQPNMSLQEVARVMPKGRNFH